MDTKIAYYNNKPCVGYDTDLHYPAEEVSNYCTTNYSHTIDTIIAASEHRNILTGTCTNYYHT
jgi:hypothetical protein